MKKRLLPVLLAASLLTGTAAAADLPEVTVPTIWGGSENDSTAQTTSTATSDPLLDLLKQEMTPQQLADFLAAQDVAQDVSSTLSLEEIEGLVRSYNLTIRATQQVIPGKKALVDEAIKELEDGIDDLEDAIDDINDGIEAMEDMVDEYDDMIDDFSDLAAASGVAAQAGGQLAPLFGNDAALGGGIAGLLISDQMTLESQIEQMDAQKESLEDQIDDLQEQIEELEDTDWTSAEREIAASFDQLAMGAETLYIGLHTMQANYDALLRQQAIAQIQLNTLNKRYELGQISAVGLAEVRDSLRELTRARESLEMTIRNSQGDLNLLLGRNADINFSLVTLPEVSQNDIVSMNLEADLVRAMNNSYTIYAAQKAVTDARDGEDADREYNIRQAEYTLQSTKNSFRQSFTKLFRAVEDAILAVEAETGSRGFTHTQLTVAKTKYDLGQISYNDYVDAQNNMAQADADLKTAKNNLLLAYNNYKWAIRGVIS